MIEALEEIEVFGLSTLALIKDLARINKKRRYRICFSKPEDLVQEMVLVAFRDTYFRPHRHPKHKAESYHVLSGELDVVIYNEDGSVNRRTRLNEKAPFMKTRSGWFHQPIPVSEWVAYHEVYEGPFVKEEDVFYAPWSAPEKD